MAPEKQEAASRAFEQLGLPDNTEVSASHNPAPWRARLYMRYLAFSAWQMAVLKFCRPWLSVEQDIHERVVGNILLLASQTGLHDAK